MYKVIDISAYQRGANLEEARNNGVSGFIFRMGVGDNYESQDDGSFEDFVNQAEGLGMPWGTYLFSYAINDENANSEIEHALRCLNGKNPKLGVWYDVESGDPNDYKRRNGFEDSEHGAELTQWTKNFISAMNANGYVAGLYCDHYHTGFIDVSQIEHLWVAAYYNEPDLNNPPCECDMWQYTSSEAIGGVADRVDTNVVYAQWMIDILEPHVPEPEVIPEPVQEPVEYWECMTYQAYANDHWMPTVNGYDRNDADNGYAGVLGAPISGIAVDPSGYGLNLRVHLRDENRWLPVVNYMDINDDNGYAGILGKPIDCVEMWTNEGRDIRYQVHTIEHGWYDDVLGNQHNIDDLHNGFAGMYGETIDAFICHLA